MGLLRRMLGLGKKQEKPYVDAGIALMHKLITKFNLSDWKDLLPSYNEEEIEAINKRWARFQSIANDVVGADAQNSIRMILPSTYRECWLVRRYPNLRATLGNFRISFR